MGGDHAPAEIVAGAVQAAPFINGTISLVGIPAQIQAHLPTPAPPQINIVPASEVVTMDDKPTEALRKKKDSSIAVSIELVKAGVADAVVSAGNTGAVTAASLIGWRQMKGIHRPAIAAVFPHRHGHFLLLDAGASPDIDPSNLVEFGLLGRIYAEHVMGIKDPRVHLLNIGEEEGKGNAFAKHAYHVLSQRDWFKGNIEGKDMFRGETDVVLCDAFVGNIVLKSAEGIAEFMMGSIRDALPTGTLARLPYLPLRSLLAPLRKKTDYTEYGGMPLLGLNGLTFICHGRSNSKAIKNALLYAQRAVDANLLEKMRESVSSSLST